MANEMITGIEQLAARKEGTVGDVESIDATDVDVRVSDVSFTLQPTMFERNLVRDTYTGYPDITAGDSTNKVTLVNASFGFEMTGHSSGVGSVPGWSKFMQSCGRRQFSDCAELELAGAITGGPFQNGETVTGATSGATAVLIGDHFTGESFVRTRTTGGGSSGVFTDGEEIEGSVSGATANLAASGAQTDDAGTSWAPISDVDSSAIESLTIGGYKDSYRIVARGCRGSMSLPFQWGDKLMVLCTYQGILSAQDSTGLFTTGVVYPQQIPPRFRGANLIIQGGSDSEWSAARLSQLSIDLGNNVVVRQNVNAADGYDPALITGRASTGSFNPDMVPTGTQKVLEHWYTGATAHARWDLGDTAGNRFQFKMPALQYTGITNGNRDNVYTAEANFKLTGGLFSGAAQNLVGADNEFIIHYR